MKIQVIGVVLLGLAMISSSQDADRGPDLDVDSTDISNYIDICMPQIEKEADLAAIAILASEMCTENVLDRGDVECDSKPSIRYAFDTKQQSCVAFEYRGCGGNDNNFETMVQCKALCQDPCTQPKDFGSRENVVNGTSVPCANTWGLYYYYDQSSISCQEFFYEGCGGNGNRFESKEECAEICRAASTTGGGVKPQQPTREPEQATGIISRGKRQTTGDQVDEISQPKFCRNFQENYPEMVKILSNDTNIRREMEAEFKLDGDQSEAGTRSKRNSYYGGLLKHTSIEVDSSCRRIEITIRIYCAKAWFYRPSEDQKRKLCNLVKQGIKKHWETDIRSSYSNYQVIVTVVEDSRWYYKKVVLKWYSRPPIFDNIRSYNLGRTWHPMVVKYKGYYGGYEEDLNFMNTAAHEFGHDVLRASDGLIFSWGHEGTSTIFGSSVGATPYYPSDSTSTINLMWYYKGYRPYNHYNRVKASQSQIKSLVRLAGSRHIPWWCERTYNRVF